MKNGMLSHHLAHGVDLNPSLLRQWLRDDHKLGYSGMVIVPALMDLERYEIKHYVDVFSSESMTGLVCGFNAGNGPDPLHWQEQSSAAGNLIRTLQLVTALADAGCSDRLMVGPVHTHHRNMRVTSEEWSGDAFLGWLDTLQELGRDHSVNIAIEPLNGIEDCTPDPFRAVFNAINEGRDNLSIQWDMGHAHWHGLEASDMLGMASSIQYLEWANAGRWPLSKDQGIDFGAYVKARAGLGDSCVEGNEPFDPKVIEAFGLGELCDTSIPGPRCLAMNATFFQDAGIMSSL